MVHKLKGKESKKLIYTLPENFLDFIKKENWDFSRGSFGRYNIDKLSKDKALIKRISTNKIFGKKLYWVKYWDISKGKITPTYYFKSKKKTINFIKKIMKKLD